MEFRSTTRTLALAALGLTIGLSLAACGGNSTVADDPDSGANNNNAAECGNGVIETGEDCDTTALGGQDCADLNLGTGDLTCTGGCTYDTSGCSEQPVCGNDEVEYGEACDGADLGGASCVSQGFASGDLACDASCEFVVSGCNSCGNDVVDTGEQCDGADLAGETCASQGLGTGDLACATTCTFDVSDCSEQPVCGDNAAEGPEECDGTDLRGEDCTSQGLGTGALDCTAGCTFDTSACAWCGNDQVDSGEDCDGTDLDGETCVSQGLGAGTLVCTANCGFDTSGCGPACGNGTVDTGEDCDGGDLGGATCVSQGYVGGTLACTGACTFDDSGCSNCETPDNTAPTASNHVPAPETLGAPQATPISVDLFDSCGVDTTSVTMRITITPKFGPATVISVVPTVTGTGTNVTATYNHPGGFTPGTIVEVMLAANDINANTLSETWRFSVVDTMQLFSGGSGGMSLTNPIDESVPNTNLSSFAESELIGGAAGSERRYLIRFSPPVPLGALIFSATLWAGVCPPGASVTTTLDCYQLNVTSSPVHSTWNDRETAVPWSVAGADGTPADRAATAAGSIPFDSTTPPYTWIGDDVTALVTNWAAGDGYHGIVCMNESATPITVCSPYSNAPPKIDLTFGPPLP